jgi:release factor glutamine methyltransferase
MASELFRLTARLAAAGITSARAEARLLLAAVAAVPPGQIELLDHLPAQAAAALEQAVSQRLAGQPLQHITGRAYFRTIEVAVGPGVFIPRPETEVMTGWVLQQLAGSAELRVVELCAGSGAISLALAAERPGLRQWAVEQSAAALAYLVANTAGSAIQVVAQDMAQALPAANGSIDWVVANPPYLPAAVWRQLPAEVRDFDPVEALLAGDDGLSAIRQVATVAARLLKPGGQVACEHDDGQGVSASEIFRAAGFTAVADHRDWTGRPRFLTARWLAASNGAGLAEG